MRLDYLRYFNHLAKVLHYTKAAEELYIAQPTLSVAIKRMEQELGLTLFRRGDGASKVQLTEAGMAFQEYVDLALRDYETGLRVARERQGQANASISVGTIYAMQGRSWSQALKAFSATCAEAPQVSVEQAYSPILTDRVRRRELDVAFAAMVEGADDLNRTLVWSQPLVLCVNREHPLARRSSISTEDLMGREVLTYAPTSPVSPALDRLLPCEGLCLRREYDDEITLCAMVSSDDQKMALLCYSFLVEAFEDVVCVRVSDLPTDFHKVYLLSRRESRPKIVDDFVSFMASYRFPNAFDAPAPVCVAG